MKPLFEYDLVKVGTTALAVQFVNVQPEFGKFRNTGVLGENGCYSIASFNAPSMVSNFLCIPGAAHTCDGALTTFTFASTERRDEAYDAFKHLLDEFLAENQPWTPKEGKYIYIVVECNVLSCPYSERIWLRVHQEGRVFPYTKEGHKAAFEKAHELRWGSE